MSNITSDPRVERVTNWTGVLFGVWLGVLAAFQQFKLPPALPLLLDRFGYSPTLAGGFMSVYAVAGMVLSLHLGQAMQRLGATPFLAAAFALFTVGNLLGLLLPESGWLVLFGRGLEGIAFIILAILCSVFANLSISQRHLPIAAALVATWIPGGQLLANLVAPTFLRHGVWEPLWWLSVAATLATALWAWWLQGTGRVSFQFGGPPTAAEGRPAEPSAAERRSLWLTSATFMLWSTQMFAFFTWTPEFLVDRFGFDAAAATMIFTLPVLVLLVGNLVGGLILRLGAPLPALMVTVLLGQSMFWWHLPNAGPNAGSLTVMLIFGLLAGITPTCLFAAPATILGTSRAGGRAFGLLHLGRSAGVLVGPVLMAAAYQWMGSWTATAPIFGGACIASAAIAMALTFQMRR